MSGAFETCTGYDTKLFVSGGEIYFALIHPDDHQRFTQQLNQAIAEHQDLVTEYRVLHKDGNWHWARLHATCIYADNVTPLYLDGILFDITAAHNVEAQIRRLTNALPVAVYQSMLDENDVSHMLYMSETIEPLTGFSAADVLADVGILFGRIHPDDIADFVAADIAAFHARSEFSQEARFTRADGEQRWMSVRSSPYIREDGSLIYQGFIEDITERKSSEEEIRNLAFYDPLTNLPNRRLLRKHLRKCIEACAHDKTHGALIFIDLDNFKTLNDTLGHDVGDQLLIAIAQRLQQVVRKEDTVARLGGDEFVVVLSHLDTSIQQATLATQQTADKLLTVLAKTYALEQHIVTSSPSLGITLFQGDETDIDTVIKRADLAMYTAKTSGRNTVRFFTPEMKHRQAERAQAENELSTAITNREFVLYLQPQVDSGGHCFCVEALLRWQHPVKGMLAPPDFIPLIKETGHIQAISRWVLQEAMHLQKRWQQDPLTQGIDIAINLCEQELLSPTFINETQQLLLLTGANPARLQLEIPEALYLHASSHLSTVLHTLQALGMTIALDNFGQRYAALELLRHVPVHKAKISHTLIHAIATDRMTTSICQSSIMLADQLNLTIVAEGVESREQWELLHQIGCTKAQGYFFAKPMPEAAFHQWLTTRLA